MGGKKMGNKRTEGRRSQGSGRIEGIERNESGQATPDIWALSSAIFLPSIFLPTILLPLEQLLEQVLDPISQAGERRDKNGNPVQPVPNDEVGDRDQNGRWKDRGQAAPRSAPGFDGSFRQALPAMEDPLDTRGALLADDDTATGTHSDRDPVRVVSAMDFLDRHQPVSRVGSIRQECGSVLFA